MLEAEVYKGSQGWYIAGDRGTGKDGEESETREGEKDGAMMSIITCGVWAARERRWVA